LLQQIAPSSAPPGLKKRRFLRRKKMRKFLHHYARYSSIAEAADRVGVSLIELLTNQR